ncbi:hypothetical protein [Pseudomonas sp. ICMP 561]|uniref:hypothetical protein n=1 Tax=Pseudomonas sp. ICMP 561 TaxID=1718918 RepID=UPI000C070E09|nr:hypothetical protein [Pseudomonas sp. ICMP 561]PHN32332.1 hypothetical protein AO242_05650 [Pseudomonas sp. ICMP 561]
MFTTPFTTFVEEQIAQAEQKLYTGKSARLDDVAYGKLGFYLALRRVLEGTSTSEDLGLIEAVNDTLQALQLLDGDETFLSGIKQEIAGKGPRQP